MNPLRRCASSPSPAGGGRSQWPGEAGSTAALDGARASEAPEPRLAGDGVVWLLVLAELLTFGLLFASFAVARRLQPGMFAQGQAELSLSTGVLNTLLLVAGSWAAVRAVRSFEADRRVAGARWLLAALAGAVGFLVVKSHEFLGKVQAGFDWATNTFTLLYTLLTGFHYLHVLVGAIVFAVLWHKARQGAYSQSDHMGPTAGAVFWHMVDLLWMVLFPLVYVIR